MSENVGAMDSYLGEAFDDGVFTGIRKVYVTYSSFGISHIMVDYDKAGQLVTLQNGDMKGENRVQGKQNEFVVHYPEEYITSVQGTWDRILGITNRVRSLSFKTSKDRMSPTYGIVGNKTFLLESKGKALVGFHGRASWAIDVIGAYFGPTPMEILHGKGGNRGDTWENDFFESLRKIYLVQGESSVSPFISTPLGLAPELVSIKLQYQGGIGGNQWDHGAYYGIRKVYVTSSPSGISHLMVDYDKAGKVATLETGDMKGENRVQGQQKEFILDYPDEYITSVEGTCDLIPGFHNRVRSLSFKTSKKRLSPTYGVVGKQTFVLKSKGKALVGFHGRSGLAIDAIGAYFGPPPIEILQVASTKLQYQGGCGGSSWDHGAYSGIRKVYVTYSPIGMSHIMVDYDKAGKVATLQSGDMKGENRVQGQQNEFELDYPAEYITSVEGTCDLIPGFHNRVRSLNFKTSKERVSPTYGIVGKQKFVLESKGKALVGFHGRSGWAIDAIGAYFGPPSIEILQVASTKLQYQGGCGGSSWDHGAYSGIRKVYVTYSPTGMSHIMVDYDKAGKVATLQSGDMKGENRVQGQQNEFELDYPDEYITSVEGTCDLIPGFHNRVRSLSFKTSKERMSPTYGIVGKQKFVLESNSKALVGFHGRSGWAIDAIGGYFGPPPLVKLQEKGYDGGASWKDGGFNGVTKIYMV